jgi:hypothetical protein
MSSLRDRLAASTKARLSVVTGAAANLIAQLSELRELREQVRKAQLSAQKSRQTNRRKRRNLKKGGRFSIKLTHIKPLGK